MKYYDLVSETDFDERDIPTPKTLESEEDYAQLFQHLVSYFRLSINCYNRMYGYENRQRLLVSILKALNTVMPMVSPEYIRDYPNSIEDIYGLIGRLIVMAPGIHNSGSQVNEAVT